MYYDCKHEFSTDYIQRDLILINNYDVTLEVNKNIKVLKLSKKVLPNERFAVTDILGFNELKCLIKIIFQ